MPAAARAYLGIGSNLDRPAHQVAAALRELAHLPGSRLLAQSRLYCSGPLGPQDQPDFINAVALLETTLAPQELLRELHGLEALHGRERRTELHWGPRPLDLDILIYGELRMSTEELTLPHPRMHERSFVLWPLAELAPDLVIPGRGRVQALREACKQPPIQLYAEPSRG